MDQNLEGHAFYRRSYKSVYWKNCETIRELYRQFIFGRESKHLQTSHIKSILIRELHNELAKAPGATFCPMANAEVKCIHDSSTYHQCTYHDHNIDEKK